MKVEFCGLSPICVKTPKPLFVGDAAAVCSPLLSATGANFGIVPPIQHLVRDKIESVVPGLRVGASIHHSKRVTEVIAQPN